MEINTKDNTKYCPACNSYKDRSDFSPRRQSPDGLRSSCKVCKNLYDRTMRLEKSGKKEALSKEEKVKLKEEKRHKTNIIKYGVINPLANLDIRNKMEKTLLNKYGSKNFAQTQEYRDIRSGRSTKVELPESYKILSRAEKIKLGFKKKYGVDNIFQTEEFKIKAKETFIKNYGVDHPLKSELGITKLKNTCLEKYGVDNPAKNKEFIQKAKDTCTVKYGVYTYSNTQEFKDRLRSLSNKINETGETFMEYCNRKGGTLSWCRILYNNYGFEVLEKWVNDKISPFDKQNKLEKYFADLVPIAQFFDLPLTQHHIYLRPDFKLDEVNYIDVDGLYWHSEVQLEPKHHMEKRKIYEGLGLRLFQFREDEIKYKGNIIKSMVEGFKGQFNKVYARKCEISKISWEEASNFYMDNHLQGKGTTSTNYGLKYDGKLVQVMGFRFKNDRKDIEISRVATLLNTRVVGGFTRLLKHIIDDTKCETIYSFCDLRYSQGNVYEKNGFTTLRETLGWSWTDFKVTYNRMQCRATKEATERENAEALGWVKIYDAGQRLYVKYINQT